jgi:hypothetical protein
MKEGSLTEAQHTGISLSMAGRLLIGFVLAAGLAATAQQLSLKGEHRSDAGQQAEVADFARRMLVYRFEPGRWTTFRFSQPVRQARIITHPILGAGTADPGESWTYAVRAELLDDNGQVLERRDLYSRTILYDRDGHLRVPLRQYRGSSELVAPSDEIRIAAVQPVSAIRLLTAERDRDVIAVDVRVSERRPLLTSTASLAFLRYSPEDKARLASPNAFPYELLTPVERANIAINQWRPVGPIGIDGREYRMRVLYEEEDEAKESDELRFDPEDGE